MTSDTSPSARPSAPPPDETAWEECRQKFRAACAGQAVPAVRDLRGWLPPLPPDRQADILVDLVGEHLRHSWQRGRGARVEEYVAEFGAAFADFASADALSVDLIECEFIARYEFDPFADHPGLDEYARRFPCRPEVLAQL